jgi:DNA-binding response OmpR family regulator
VRCECLTEAGTQGAHVRHPESAGQILIASADQALSNSRKQLLEKESWKVSVTRNKQHGLAVLHSESFALLLICDSLSLRTVREYIKLFRETQPTGKILVIERGRPLDVDCDAVLPSPVEPRQLVHQVRRLLS